MPSQTSIKFDLTGQVAGNTAGQRCSAGLYKYTVDATFGTSSVLHAEALAGDDWIDLIAIDQSTALTDTGTGARTQSLDVYLPEGQVRMVVATDTMTDGFATFAPILTNNV